MTEPAYLLREQPGCRHTRCPETYLLWHEWAEQKAETHVQERCPVCGLWAIWRPRPPATGGAGRNE